MGYYRFVFLRVTVQSGQKIIDPEISEERGQKAEDRDQGRTAPLPTHDNSSVEVEGEDEPGDERPDLLRVPAPVGAPGLVSPDHSEDEPSQREEGKAHGDRPVAHGVVALGGPRSFLALRPTASSIG